MSETIYVKVGRRYKPIYEYDQKVCDSFPEGSHLVVCEPGHQLKRYRIDPDYAPILAAISKGRDAMVSAIHNATELRYARNTPLSQQELEAFEAWKKATGQETLRLERASAVEVFEAFEKALIEATKRESERSEDEPLGTRG